MDVNKYIKPNLPAMTLILEDLSDSDIVQLNEAAKSSLGDEVLQNAYNCFDNFKLLAKDLDKQQELNLKLEELNHKLIENIESMKKQT